MSEVQFVVLDRTKLAELAMFLAALRSSGNFSVFDILQPLPSQTGLTLLLLTISSGGCVGERGGEEGGGWWGGW